LKEHFLELLKAHQTYLSPPDDVSAEDLKDLSRKAKLASSTFQAIFGSRLNQNPGVLQSSTAIDTMMGWTSEMLPFQERLEATPQEESFNNQKSFSNRLQELTSVMSDSVHAGLWPFIRKLKYIHLPST
jgi:hypothetical protein